MVMPCQLIERVIFGKNPMVERLSPGPITKDQIQPASLDMTLAGEAFAMKSAALPHEEMVFELIEQYQKYPFTLSSQKENVLHRGVCHLIPLAETFSLSDGVWAEFSPKSSTGRNDVFVRVLADKHPHYDRVPPGYCGPVFLEVTPLSFDVSVQPGLSLTQARFKTKMSRVLTEDDVALLHAEYGIVFDRDGDPVSNGGLRTSREGGMYLHVDLDREIVGFEALSSPTERIDLCKINAHEPRDFWRPLYRPKNRQLVLTPGCFYLLTTKERVRIPPTCCAEILPFEITTGEIRPHYAGFFDNGFGGESGTHGILEVRCRDVPFRVVDDQPVCRMVFEETFKRPERLYGGNYTDYRPSLSKHFKGRYDAWTAAFWKT